MRSQIIVLALFAIVGLAAPSPVGNDIIPRGCPGGGPGNACPEGLFQVCIVLLCFSCERRASCAVTDYARTWNSALDSALNAALLAPKQPIPET